MNKIYKFGLTFLILAFLSVISINKVFAQIEEDQVDWSASIEKTGDSTANLIFKGHIQPQWHIYGLSIPDGGPTATQVKIEKIINATKIGQLTSTPKAKEHWDSAFNMNIGVLSGEVILTQPLSVTNFNNLTVEGYLKFMACTEENCTPPQTWDFNITYSPSGNISKTNNQKTTIETTKTNGISKEVAVITNDSLTQDFSGIDKSKDYSTEIEPITTNIFSYDLWTPVIDELKAFGDKTASSANSSLWIIFISGFVGGLIALMTPCVWPMIPMTVSFFLKRSKDRKKGIKDAIIYGIGIIVIYLVLGLLVTGLLGADALNSLATKAIPNIIFFLLLIFFAISFFGAFEIVLPAKWSNKMNEKADSTIGVLSIFFMSFTLALVSFSCTGPIIGTLLVQAASMGNYTGPAIGMFGFSLALALPFTLFAIFPSGLKSMPKSGGWLNSVKVVLAFLELALSLKFLSVADLAYGWHILDREVFISIWIIIFTLLGLYLLGKIRFSHDSPKDHTSVTGLFMSIISFSFAVYMIPGLWGAPLKAISAFAPPLTTQDFNLYEGSVHAKFDDYDVGMEYAQKVGKPVLIDFSGFGCVNCRKMEAAVWSDPIVKDILENKYVLITLMVDDKTDLPSPITVNDAGKERKIRTIGEKWSFLQRHKFGSNTQPYYIALDNNGHPLAPSRSYNENIKEYIDFLNLGISNYKKTSEK